MQMSTLISPSVISDGTYIAQSLAGDQYAFTQLTQRYHRQLLLFIRSCLQSVEGEEAEDILQHVWLQLYLYLPTLDTSISIKPWLFRVAWNRCRDIQRKTWRRRTISFSTLEQEIEEEGRIPEALICDPDLLPEALAEHHDLQCTIDRAIEQLPSRYREIVALRYKGQMTFTEIGRQLNIPLSTAKTYFHRAKKHLCVMLKEDKRMYELDRCLLKNS
jgi:RNA polymerase sigma-70 factor, ECF subfamily